MTDTPFPQGEQSLHLWATRYQWAVANGRAVHKWGRDDEGMCMLCSLAPGEICSPSAPCLDVIGPVWIREFFLAAYNNATNSKAWANEVTNYCLTLPNRPLPDIRHRFASEVVLREALRHFDHAKWPEVKRVIYEKIALHRRALAGDEPNAEEWREVENRAARAALAALTAGAARALGATWAARAARASCDAEAAGAGCASEAAEAARAAWVRAVWPARGRAASYLRMADGFLAILKEETPQEDRSKAQ